jgi:hypothetical protein
LAKQPHKIVHYAELALASNQRSDLQAENPTELDPDQLTCCKAVLQETAGEISVMRY